MSTIILAAAFRFSYTKELQLVDRLISNTEASSGNELLKEEASVLAAYDRELSSLLECAQKTSCLLAKAALI